jgi:hypothetical protein
MGSVNPIRPASDTPRFRAPGISSWYVTNGVYGCNVFKRKNREITRFSTWRSRASTWWSIVSFEAYLP